MPYCPNCKDEYREGFKRCAYCDVDLVDELPPEEEKPNDDELRDVEHRMVALEDEAVLETFTEPVEFMYVASMLDEMDIPYLVRNAKGEKEFLFKKLYSFNAHINKTIYVSDKDYERAEEVLESLDAYLMEDYDEEEDAEDAVDDGDYEE